METVGFIAVFHMRRLELLLALATILLFSQLAWPIIRHGWRLPALRKTGFHAFPTPTPGANMPFAYRSNIASGKLGR